MLQCDPSRGGAHSVVEQRAALLMIDYNTPDDPRVTPKPQHKDAWQSPESLLQFAIGVYSQHKPEGLDRKQHVNFRPAVRMWRHRNDLSPLLTTVVTLPGSTPTGA